jgi:hypothetical protein
MGRTIAAFHYMMYRLNTPPLNKRAKAKELGTVLNITIHNGYSKNCFKLNPKTGAKISRTDLNNASLVKHINYKMDHIYA